MTDNRPTDSAVFQNFVSKASNRSNADANAANSRATSFHQITVLGGGLDARLLAAMCFSEGADVQVFSAYAAEIAAMQNGIALNGAGPIGRYHVVTDASQQQRGTAIRTTGSIDAGVLDAELIFLTGPVHKQRTYAMVLADHLKDGQVLVLPNAKTFGALEAQWLLRVGGCTADITLVEMQSLPYWITTTEQQPTALQLQPSTALGCACLPATRTIKTLDALTPLLGDLHPLTSVLHSSFSDCSATIEIPALLLGGMALSAGGHPIPMGGTALSENDSFYNLLGDEQVLALEQLLAERREVAARFGVRDMPDTEQALHQWAGQPTGEGRRAIPDQSSAKATIRDGVIGSLVPLASAAKAAGVATPLTDSMINLCSALLGTNLSVSGRNLASFGIDCATSAGNTPVFEALSAATQRVLGAGNPTNNHGR